MLNKMSPELERDYIQLCDFQNFWMPCWQWHCCATFRSFKIQDAKVFHCDWLLPKCWFFTKYDNINTYLSNQFLQQVLLLPN